MLNGLIEEKKDEVLAAWLDKVLMTYPADSRKYIRSRKDPFQNPVGSTLRREMIAFLDAVGDEEKAELTPFFVDFIKVRAVQEFRPSEAIAFILELKAVIREVLAKELAKDQKNLLNRELHRFDCFIDRLALSAFDLYMADRERIYAIKANEMKNRTALLVEKLTGERPDTRVQCPSGIMDADRENDSRKNEER